MKPPGPPLSVEIMQHEIYVMLYAATAGFTVSGIASSIYRLAVKKRAASSLSRLTYLAVMIVAGPTVLFENAAKSWRAKSCTGLSFSIAASIAAYWSLALGLLVLQIVLALSKA
jgi:hypothetical protein